VFDEAYPMTVKASRRPRPLSPFMIGPHYRPQLTSMMSISHRISGVLLSLGALLVVAWLLAVAAGPDGYAGFSSFASSLLGRALGLALVCSIVYHWLNGMRHLFWDLGLGLDISKAYSSGWAIVVTTVVLSVLLGWLLIAGGAQ
jgi:succinate dehydrogenase / fumarate reductase cytochrome b subunit